MKVAIIYLNAVCLNPIKNDMRKIKIYVHEV